MTGQGATLARLHPRHWPVLVKLVAVLLVPTLAALIVGVLRIADQAGAVPGYLRISQIAGVQQQLSELIGTVQRERELAAAFVGAGRSGDRSPLELQFDAVQTRSAVVLAAAERVDELEPTGYRSVLEDLRALRPLRQSVLAGIESGEVVVTEYGAAIDPLIALDAALVRKLDTAAVADHAAAGHALLVSREQVSRQHAIVSAALPVNLIRPAQLDQLRAAAVRLDAELEAFTAALEPAQRGGYVPRAIGEAERSRQRLLQLVLDRGAQNKPLDVTADNWNARNAAAIAELATVENELRERVDRTARELRDDARAAAGWNAAILSFALVLGVVITLLIARSMLGPLGVLRRTALDVAGRRLPAAVAGVREGAEPDQTIEPVAVSTREEIGQVARAFDEVHRQAVRLAGEQARLRAHINDIFVNLSRRSQSLVERQLQLIDKLERTEQDPGALDNLFQLDHLATRMRRNSDNLLVLAGTEATKRAGRPVRLVDVLRAALSEVEQYQRVVLQAPPDVLVLGRAAGDLAHLLAELLDNATQFSPPDTQVVVSAELDADGEVLIEVTDRGVGMTEPELVEVNERLAGTPVVDASVSRRMGLFVIGRLAVRHDIAVRLRGGADGRGMCAAVRMPSRLIRPVPDGDPHGPGDVLDGSLAANGSVPDRAEPVAGGTADPSPASESPAHVNDTGGPLTNRNGLRPAEPPMPAVPSSPPLTTPSPSAGPADDLFRPSPSAGMPAPARPGVMLQRSTPIFDDVATAWFHENEAVPMRWTAVDPPADPPADPPVDSPPGSSSQLAGESIAAAAQADPVGSAAAATDPAAKSPREDRGAGDKGWQTAQALASPAPGAEVTAAGLPRRKPRALLMSGAVGGSAPADPGNAPARSAERIRGRLASYQQGLRDGRHVRRHQDQHASGSHHQQDAEEEKQ